MVSASSPSTDILSVFRLLAREMVFEAKLRLSPGSPAGVGCSTHQRKWVAWHPRCNNLSQLRFCRVALWLQ
jgi:hypothetical protein